MLTFILRVLDIHSIQGFLEIEVGENACVGKEVEKVSSWLLSSQLASYRTENFET